ncbi:MAG: SprT family zinc-dependent metalloprotease [Pseudomonadota bacterium]|nr:SprT family zinc-dependent metalloprotease [Pseudomonadota bacterium]MDP1572918.1 SprT family zinc-dependent metalloprotease [Pseudomonadota bacterium]MDP1906154.1 SprT family zinc-dependent metalloprotease [Pseudomonadota bacterium]
MRRFIHYGEARIGFTINFVARRAKRVAIHVHPDGAVEVDAPEDTEVGEVVAAVRRRARWIWQRLRACRERARHVLPREYVSGESHFYLGRRHLLKVSIQPAQPQGVKLLRGRLEISSRSSAADKVRGLLEGWYRHRAGEVFARRLADCAAKVPWLKTAPNFRLLTMRTQWGSCSPKGELLLNPLLVKAPGQCVDYVIFHELCHLREHNHSPKFYALLGAQLPDWEKRKAELDELAEQLLNR